MRKFLCLLCNLLRNCNDLKVIHPVDVLNLFIRFFDRIHNLLQPEVYFLTVSFDYSRLYFQIHPNFLLTLFHRSTKYSVTFKFLHYILRSVVYDTPYSRKWKGGFLFFYVIFLSCHFPDSALRILLSHTPRSLLSLLTYSGYGSGSVQYEHRVPPTLCRL